MIQMKRIATVILLGMFSMGCECTLFKGKTPGVSVVSRESSVVASHLCGALTKAGKKCTRKVKAEGFCWQHRGEK